MITDADLADVARFIDSMKVLDLNLPVWTRSPHPGELQANWPILDDLQIVRGHLRFRVSREQPDAPSVSLIYKGNAVSRLDVVPVAECKLNPPWVNVLGLPFEVCGPHLHAWQDNRAFVRRSGTWALPARRPVEKGLRRVPQMLPWIADSVGITLLPEQRAFAAPAKTELF